MTGLGHPKNLGTDRHTSNGTGIFQPAGQSPVADSRITQKEDSNLKAYQELRLSQLSLDEYSNLNRPSYGDKGDRVTLWTNYMGLSIDIEKHLFTYEIVIDDRLKFRRKRQHFMESALRHLPELRALGSGVATDYASLIVASAKLDLGPNDHKTFTLAFYDTELREGRVMAPLDNPFALKVSLIGPLSSSDLLRFVGPDLINSNHLDTADTEAVRALNIIMASQPNKDPNVYQGGQNKFYRYPSQQEFSNYDLEGGLIAVRGYYSSVRFSTSRILLNLQAQCTAFYKDMNALELIQEFQKSAPGNWPALEQFLRDLRVKTSYMKTPEGTPLPKVKSIIGFSRKDMQANGNGNANNIRFELRGRQSEETVSVTEYFLTQYGVTLKHPEAIVVNCGTTDHPVWIPPELCTVMPGQPHRLPLNDVQLARMITIAARPPAENAARITAEDGGLGLIGVLPSTCDGLAAFGVTVDPNMIAVPGRVLPAPRVMYLGNSTAGTVGGLWNMKNKKVLKPKTFSDWTILRIGAAANIKNTEFERQCKALTEGFRSSGLYVNAPQVFPGPSIPAFDENRDDAVAFVDSNLRAILKSCKARNIGIHTHCVQMERLRRQDASYSANVALKLNLKLGGTNQAISSNDLGFLRHGNSILVGIDVTHPAPGTMRGIPSIAGVVASIDPNFAQWPGNICCQESKKEMVSNLDSMMEERLEYWVSKNPEKKLENIVIYRDGVSEGQYRTVQHTEIPAIRKACAKVFPDAPPPKITFLIVGKRHHTRFYPTDKNKADQKHNCNIKNGTVVDRGITMPQGWDFYMAAHAAIHGTTKPAHYVVLLDENNLSANEMEKMTHNLCYLHGRATKAVSVCPPAYYADLICERARCYLAEYIRRNPGKEFDWNHAPWRSGVHENLKNSMFYI